MRECDICGVYWIRNLVTDKVYIGATSRCIPQRWNEHRWLLRRGKHQTPSLQEAWTEYGEAAFEFMVLQTTACGESPRKVEQDWIDRVRMDGFKVYNSETKIRRVLTTFTLSEEARRKMSLAMRGNKHALGTTRPQHAIDATVLARAIAHRALVNIRTGEQVPAGSNVSKLARQLRIPRTTLRHVLSGHVKQTRTGWMVDE